MSGVVVKATSKASVRQTMTACLWVQRVAGVIDGFLGVLLG